MKLTISSHSNTMIYNSMYKRKYGLEKKETTFLYKYNAPHDFHNYSLMNSNVKSRIAGKEAGVWRWGHEGRECKRNVLRQYTISV
jgi:hypothetical protein